MMFPSVQRDDGTFMTTFRVIKQGGINVFETGRGCVLVLHAAKLLTKKPQTPFLIIRGEEVYHWFIRRNEKGRSFDDGNGGFHWIAEGDYLIMDRQGGFGPPLLNEIPAEKYQVDDVLIFSGQSEPWTP